VTLTNAATARLDAWVDFNSNGVFDHPSEQIFNSLVIVAGVNPLTFGVPVTAVSVVTYARFRVSPNGGLTPRASAAPGKSRTTRSRSRKLSSSTTATRRSRT